MLLSQTSVWEMPFFSLAIQGFITHKIFLNIFLKIIAHNNQNQGCCAREPLNAGVLLVARSGHHCPQSRKPMGYRCAATTESRFKEDVPQRNRLLISEYSLYETMVCVSLSTCYKLATTYCQIGRIKLATTSKIS